MGAEFLLALGPEKCAQNDFRFDGLSGITASNGKWTVFLTEHRSEGEGSKIRSESEDGEVMLGSQSGSRHLPMSSLFWKRTWAGPKKKRGL